MRGRTAAWLLPALLFIGLHARTLDYGFVWVDEAEIVTGSILRPPGRILAAFGEPLQDLSGFAVRPFSQPYYRPLQVVLASALDAVFGREPRTFRAASLLLGAATASLFGLLALGVLRRPLPATLSAAVFAVHPVGLETYVWISGLSAALVGLFLVASLLAGQAALATRGRARATWVGASAVALALGLLSKENAAVAPALQLALAASAVADARRAGGGGPPWRATAALVGLQAGLVALYLFALRPAVLGRSFTGAEWIGGSFATQWWTSFALWPEVLAWLFAPLHSTTSDAVRVVASGRDPLALAGLALAAGSALAWAVCLRRGHAAAAAGLAWIWIAFLPTSGITPLLHAHAERNLFLSVFGAALLWGAALGALRRRGLSEAVCAALAAALVALLAQRSWARAPAWRSTTELFERDVAADPRHREGRLNLAVAYLLAGRVDEAKRAADALAAQQPAQEGWHSYLLEQNLRQLVCIANAAAGRDADTFRRYPLAAPPSSAEIWREPGFRACQAEALERLGRCALALPIYEELARGARGDDAAAFAQAAERCAGGEP